MKVNNSEQKEIDKPEEWSLTKHVSTFINEDTEFKFSRAFGKEQPLIVRAFVTTANAVVYFFSELFKAAKTIIREIM